MSVFLATEVDRKILSEHYGHGRGGRRSGWPSCAVCPAPCEELISTLGALFPRGGPVQDPVLTPPPSKSTKPRLRLDHFLPEARHSRLTSHLRFGSLTAWSAPTPPNAKP